MSKITIGLPIVDNVEQLGLAVQSIFAQTFTNWELIIVCDGSPVEVANKAKKIQDDRVRVIVHRENRGLPVRLNEISELADSPYVARMDSDDVMHPDRISALIQYLEENPDVDVIGSGSYLVNETYQVLGSYNEPRLPKSPYGYLNSGIFSHPTVAFKKAWALANPYDPARVRTEDKELWLRTFAFSNFAKLDDRLLFCMVPRQLSLRKQALTASYDRKLILESGAAIAPKGLVYFKIAQSLSKQAVFFLSHKLGLIGQIHATKYSRLDEDELALAQAVLSGVKQVKVPGWE
ncbi:glycosyltransferase family A protein [Sinomonas albida]|uniref:glycosyltransferase family 2 protein n=1 Tax=Sinomonas albida TaxID=369942 RepID=UPI00301ABC67